MFLAFNIQDIITVPFGYLLNWLYQFTTNYGVALILFAVIVRLVLLPITAKSKKSMMKMSRIQPRIQEIQKKYENDQQKQQEAIRQLQQEEGVGMGCGGCLWSLVPLLILIPLYQVIRQPLTFMLHESAESVKTIIEGAKAANPDLFTDKMAYYQELIAARQSGLLNFEFLKIDLGQMPTIPFTANWAWDWAHIGVFLIPILSAGSQVVSMLLSQRANNSVITDEKGLQDKETAKKYFDKAIEIKPSQIDTRFFLALYDIEAGNTEEARETLEELLTARISPLNYASKERIQEQLDALQN